MSFGDLLVSISPALRLQAHVSLSGFYMDSGHPNSGPLGAGSLLTKPQP